MSFGAVVSKVGCSHSRGMQYDPMWDLELDPGVGSRGEGKILEILVISMYEL